MSDLYEHWKRLYILLNILQNNALKVYHTIIKKSGNGKDNSCNDIRWAWVQGGQNILLTSIPTTNE